MSAARHYTQVTMCGSDESAGRVHTAWIPSEFSRVGRVLRLDGMPGRWRVVERFASEPAERVEARSRDYLHHREASDV